MSEQDARRLSRRDFLKVAGASLGTLTGVAACERKQSSVTVTPAAATTPTSPPVVPTASPAVPTASPELTADAVLLNGKVITVDANDTIAQAIAVKDGLILAVGSGEQIQALAGEKTQVFDLQGKTVTPGLVDAHNHLQIMGLLGGYYVSFVPPEVKTLDELQAKLAGVVAQTPAGEWIQGYFLFLTEGRLPNRYDLDPVSPEHPVWIMQQGGHYGSANSLALQIANITAATPDPVGGVIERDASGEPTGVFYNHRAMDILRRHIPPYTTEMVQENIVSTQPLFAACGLTSFQDNNVRGVDTISTYLGASRRGDMILRGAVYYTLEWPADLDRALKEIEHYEDAFMRFAGFKFLLDGQPQMAYCHEPHNGVRWDTPTWEPQSFKDAVRALHDTGLQICVHCVGDAAVDLTLDAYEAAMNANPRPDPRHRIEHCILCTPQATQRMKDLGVIVSTQPQFLRLGGDSYAALFGEKRKSRVLVTREWLDAGVALALGSDAPTTPWYTPQVTLAGAVARWTLSNQVYQPDQCLTIQEALRAHTIGSAYAAHEENVKGSIEVGKMADLAVWSEDPYTASLKQLWQIPIAMTLVGGQIVYQA